VLLEYARLGGIVSLSVHMNNPQTGGPAWDANIDLAEVLRPGSVAGRDWRRQLSLIADGLEAFKEANVPVLFRPYHEMDGRWFWWGGNPEQYKRLWRETFQYLARQRELNHLLWVYSPSHRGDQLKHYPGDRWVDVVGFDAYTSDLTGATKAYRQLLTTGKPVGITEYGPIDGQPRPGAPPFDWSLMATWLAEDFPKVTFFMAWRDHWGLAQHTGAKALLTHPLIRNRSAARTIPVVEECLQEKEQ